MRRVLENSDVPERPVRVCFVIDRLSRAGTEKQLLLTIAQLDREKVTPYLCLLDGNDPLSAELLPENCEVLRLAVHRLVSATTLSQARAFWRFLKCNCIDIVQTFFPDSTRFAAPIAKFAGVKAVFGSRRDIGHWATWADAKIAKFYNRFFIDQIIANSEAGRHSVIGMEGACPERVMVLPNIIDLKLFKDILPWQPALPGKPARIGMLGNLREIKGPDLFIRAASTVLQQQPSPDFVIAGAGDPAPYQRLIDGLGIAPRVRLLGSVSNVVDFLSTLDIAVVPSRAEGLSNALMEHMAAGRPIIATDVGGNKELISHGVSGLLVKPDATSIARAVLQLLENGKMAASLAREAYGAAQNFSLEHQVGRLAAVYTSYVAS